MVGAGAVVSGAALLAAPGGALGALGVVALAAAVALVVVVALAAQVTTRWWARRRPPVTVTVRRVRVQAGLTARSYLETTAHPPRWIPVHYEAALTALPAPAAVVVHGDPARRRLVVPVVEGRPVWPSGPVRRSEPPGRRHDNAAAPDDGAVARGTRLATVASRLRGVAPFALVGPLVGVLWVFVDGGGVTAFVAVTVLFGVVGPWAALLRGHDPT